MTMQLIAWATTSDNPLGVDAGIHVEQSDPASEDPGGSALASETVDSALDGEDGRLDTAAADQLLAGMGYRRIDDWRDSGGQWGAPVEPLATDSYATTEYAGWGSVPGNGYREFDHEVAASLDDPAAYDVPALAGAYRDAINAALPDGVSLVGDEFIGPHPAPADAREQIGEALGAVDFWALVERHAR